MTKPCEFGETLITFTLFRQYQAKFDLLRNTGATMKSMKELGFSNYSITEDGRVYSHISKKFLRNSMMTSGYEKANIYNDECERKNQSIHRSVAILYVDNPDNKPFVNHIDENKLNNHYKNLEWVTGNENLQSWHDNNSDKHSSIKEYTVVPKDTELLKDNPQMGGKHFTEESVRNICKLYQKGYRKIDIHKITGFKLNVVGHLLLGNYPYWNHIVQEYDLDHIHKVKRLELSKIVEICEYLSSGKGVMEVSRLADTCRSTVGIIKNRKAYKKISKNYTW